MYLILLSVPKIKIKTYLPTAIVIIRNNSDMFNLQLSTYFSWRKMLPLLSLN